MINLTSLETNLREVDLVVTQVKANHVTSLSGMPQNGLGQVVVRARASLETNLATSLSEILLSGLVPAVDQARASPETSLREMLPKDLAQVVALARASLATNLATSPREMHPRDLVQAVTPARAGPNEAAPETHLRRAHAEIRREVTPNHRKTGRLAETQVAPKRDEIQNHHEARRTVVTRRDEIQNLRKIGRVAETRANIGEIPSVGNQTLHIAETHERNRARMLV